MSQRTGHISPESFWRECLTPRGQHPCLLQYSLRATSSLFCLSMQSWWPKCASTEAAYDSYTAMHYWDHFYLSLSCVNSTKAGILSLLFIFAPLRVAQCPEHDSSVVKGKSGDLSITPHLACYCLPQTSPQIGATWKPEPHRSLRSD